MTAADVLSVQDQGNVTTYLLPSGERTEEQSSRPGPCGEPGMFTWCEVEMLQDAVCGNGLTMMDSRDDDAPNEAEDQMVPTTAGAGNSFIDDKLKMFSQELELTQNISLSNKSSTVGLQDDNNPAIVSKLSLDGMRASINSSLLSNSSMSGSRGIEKSRYEHFMSLVDTASKTHGAQSIPVANLYVTMGTECSWNGTDAKSKELSLLLFEEAFGIYQVESGDSNEQTVDCRIHLGKTYHSLEQYDEALDCFCMAVYMREALLGELHPSVSEIWVLISSVHHAKFKLELALKASAKALTGYRHARGDKHHTVIGVLKTIAQIHIEMGNNDKAVDIQKYVRLHSKDAKAEI
mmetsp:Transcript_3487/g.7697  ORF Transcript_3487/g.7697 Transcript_3487/m.7697 type:complete len:349 (+) Transcript_3487:173-1219(+)|eukprot:CAMPEP_0172316814 /NCGR_PEP_ID=MMETSP1058-20130122/29576_1 /TAXON_ID=83371 /ORGANISM="Detonula confervacea, Strain CCMP 353" /LENGTH=348 /DNA_ID=CAMNT_0013031223 /DNA_START=58 /DNA_END=1104 /DNA_ORIENTATION=-